MKLKLKPWARNLAPAELWPETKGPRPLKPGEQIEPGATVYVDTWPQDRACVFKGWQLCWRTRYALLDSGAGYLHVVPDWQVRL